MTTAVKPEDDKLLKTKELAERWQVTERTLTNMRNQGRGPEAIPMMGSWRYRLSDVVAYEDAQKAKGTTGRPNNLAGDKGDASPA